MHLKVFLVLLVIFAIVTVQTNKLNRAVIYFASFSLISSLIYFFLSAPDVAIAQAVIGSTLSTILYFVALAKYNVFRVYCQNIKSNQILDLVTEYCELHELEVSFVKKKKTNVIIDRKDYDLLLEESNDSISLFGNRKNYHLDGLEKYICENTDKVEKGECKIVKY